MNEPGAFDTATICTSDEYWVDEYEDEDDDELEIEGDERMRPGHACIACHQANDGPDFAIAGTVYATAHEPDNCNGARDSHVSVGSS